MSGPDFEPTVPALVRSMQRFGDRLLMVFEDQRLGYREAERRSARLARGLLAHGVGKGTRVGLLMPNCPDFVVAFLAATRIGALLIPINTFYRSRELAYALGHGDVDTLLMWPELLSHDYVARLEECAPTLATQKVGALRVPELPYLRRAFVWGGCNRSWAGSDGDLEAAADAIDGDLLARVEACVTPADAAVVIYSSGSTAEPKGAVHTHGTLVRHSFNLNAYRDLGPDDRAYSPMPFFWVGGMVFTLLSTLHVGAALVCERTFEPGATLELLERERATIIAGWPHYTAAMLDHPSFATRDLSSVRAGNLYELLPEEVRPADPELRSNSLGMTETCGPHSIDAMDVDLPERLRGSFGRAVPGVRHKIVDPDSGEPRPTGEHGEICVRGYSLMQGLYKREREETFDPDGYYHTGDGGHLDDEGHLFFVARLGEMIKTAGANVAPREVEVVLDGFEELQASYVVGVPDPVRGQNVAAAVVLNQDASLDADALRSRLREQVSAYKVPRHVFFYDKAALPFTDSGKIDRRRLVEMLAARLRDGSSE